MKIHGYAALAPREPLRSFTYDAPPLEPFEILIKITHCGLCHTDLHMIEDAWHRSTYPLLPGHEIIGTVVKKGSSAEVKLGKRVGVSWVASACLQCPQCLQGDTNICPTKKGVYNNGRYGGFADHVVIDSRFAFPIPEGIDSAHAAPLLCAGATVYAPLHRHPILPSHAVGIIGIGGLGHLALQFYHAYGCEVSAISSTPSKEKEAKNFGADHFYTWENPPSPFQFDFLLCTTDAPLDWNFVLTLLRPNGTLCLVSRPAGLTFDPTYLVSTQRSICGSNNANRSVMNEMLSFAARHKIKPKIELMPLAKINEAIERVRTNSARYRIVLHN
jgi:uncharacterized zinc-type alcohol dehydrogenase-like protein